MIGRRRRIEYLSFTFNDWIELDVRGAVHHSINHKEDPTRCNSVSKFYFIFIWSLICFERHTAHHQEPKTALAASGFHTWRVVRRVVAGRWQRVLINGKWERGTHCTGGLMSPCTGLAVSLESKNNFWSSSPQNSKYIDHAIPAIRGTTREKITKD